MKINNFSLLMTTFFSKYLPGQRNLSTNTIDSYRTSFVLFLEYYSSIFGIKPDRLQMKDISQERVFSFLDWIEKERNCCISTRNQRLAALKSFFAYVATKSPENLMLCQQIAAIPQKRTSQKSLLYFSPEGTEKLLSMPDISTWIGRRDRAILVLLYDSAARVQELIDITEIDIRTELPSTVTLFGKGRKTRTTPLSSTTATIINSFLSEKKHRFPSNQDSLLFINSRGGKFTRVGIAGILDKYVKKMKENGLSEFVPGPVSPHSLRHSKAVHLLRSGVPLIYIRDFLGHSSVTTTELYATIDSEQKRKAIENAIQIPIQETSIDWQADKDLKGWLIDLCSK
ncbi:MAG: tyrosine-type recombinase/integrase [Sphaerochaetaceae bacterium]|nr:tyrosine-type recombinase/integrase [Sphaerochaetaceae bacterium]